jgi:hypothetical protein
MNLRTVSTTTTKMAFINADYYSSNDTLINDSDLPPLIVGCILAGIIIIAAFAGLGYVCFSSCRNKN